MVYQKEIGEQGTPHLQGYLETRHAWRFNRMRRFVSKRAHVEPRSKKSTRAEARDYCMKEDTRAEPPREFGMWIPDGDRSDINEFYGLVKLGVPDQELFEADIVKFANYTKAVTRIRSHIYRAEHKRRWEAGIKPFVACIWGNTGTGKTRSVMDHYGFDNIYIPPSGDGSAGSIWWENYAGQPVILMDDFYGGRMKPDYLLRLCDYPKGVPVQCKAGYTYLIPQVIIFTSNVHPQDWYSIQEEIETPSEPRYFIRTKGIPEEVYNAILRRFDIILNVDEMKKRDFEFGFPALYTQFETTSD